MKQCWNISAFLCFLLILGGCEKDDCYNYTDPDCVDYDPCKFKNPADARFLMGEVISLMDGKGRLYDTLLVTDSIYNLNRVRFIPFQRHYDSLKWFIGSEVLTQHRVERGGFPPDEAVPITLVVWKKADPICFPEAPQVDSITRILYSARRPIYINKTYRGVHGLFPNDSNEVNLYFFLEDTLKEPMGLPPSCEATLSSIVGQSSYGYRHFFQTNASGMSASPSSCYALHAKGVARGQTIHIDYRYREPDKGNFSPWISDTFDGVLINE